MTTTEEVKETRSVKVFKDHPDWDKHSKWFMMPSYLLRELFICKYTCDEEDFHFQLKWIENEHPDCVYVYTGTCCGNGTCKN